MTRKNVFLLLLGITSLQGFSQLLPNDTNTTDNKYRSGGIAIGFQNAPVFPNNYKFLVEGSSQFQGNISVGAFPDQLDTGNISIYGRTANNSPAFLSLAIATCDGCYSQISKKGDAVFRGHTPGSFIVGSDGSGDIKFVTRESATDQVRMLIDKYGKVGIGVDNTTSRGNLQIAGLQDGYSFVDTNERWEKSLLLNIGSLVNGNSGSGNRLLTFADWPVSNLNPKARTWFGIEDRKDNNRLRHTAETDGNSAFEINDKTQSKVFSIYEDGTNAIVDLVKPNSYLSVGGQSVWPIEHNFWVKNGSSKFEGNVIAATNVGIGTSNFTDGAETYRLSVKGKVRAEEVKIYTTWADYVFEKGYQLPTLQEVEKHIEEKGHLINMPSGKEVEENGLSLGEISKLQQEKIEELTLYLIQQQKEIEALKQQMKDLLEKK